MNKSPLSCFKLQKGNQDEENFKLRLAVSVRLKCSLLKLEFGPFVFEFVWNVKHTPVLMLPSVHILKTRMLGCMCGVDTLTCTQTHKAAHASVNAETI